MPEKWDLFIKKLERNGKEVLVREIMEDGGGEMVEVKTIKETTLDGGVVLMGHIGPNIVGAVKHRKGDWRETENGIEIRIGASVQYLLVNPSPIPLDVPDGASGTG